MNGNLAEINVQELCAVFIQRVGQRTQFNRGNLPWNIANLPEPETPEEMRGGLANNVDGLKWKALCFFSFLRDHYRCEPFQGGDLAVDVQHLRFQKRRAITGDYRA